MPLFYNRTNHMTKLHKMFSFQKKEIDAAFVKARLAGRCNGLKLLQAATPVEPGNGKLLIIVPGKTGKAHDRNLVRRRLKSIFYEEALHNKPFHSIVLVYKPALDLSFDQLKDFLEKCFS